MGKGSHIIKRILLAIMLIAMISPLIRGRLNIADVEKLDGSYNETIRPHYTSEGWYDGSYQQNMQKFTEENIGFRNFLVRLNNQLAFWVFKEAKAKEVVVGKNNYIFEQNYIDSYFGRDFVGDSTINEKTRKLKEIVDTLNSKGIDLMVVIAPGKGQFYPEHIPDRFYKGGRSRTNYEAYLEKLNEHKIPYIDFNDYFKKQKESTKYTLYTNGGIHWSYYGEVMVADSIIKFVQRLKNISTPQIEIERIETSFEPKKTDNDAEKGMNLLYGLSSEEMAYPIFKYTEGENSKKIKSLVVSDSFFWSLYGEGFSWKAFDDGQFWYYNREIYQPSIGLYKKVVEIDSKVNEIEKNELIILMATEANLDDFAFGFIDRVYSEYKKERVLTYDEKVEKYRMCIVGNPEWLEAVRKSAIKDNVTLEEQILKNAKYMVSMENE